MLKRIDVHLKNVPELVSTCLVLHNICIILGDNFGRRSGCKRHWTRCTMGQCDTSGAYESRETCGGQPRCIALLELKKVPERHWSISNKRLLKNIK